MRAGVPRRRRAATPIATDDAVDDFSVRNLGFQIRYRYELAPLSYLYVVYGRGGYQQDPFSEDADELVRDSLELRDDEQLLVKLSYRFEIWMARRPRTGTRRRDPRLSRRAHASTSPRRQDLQTGHPVACAAPAPTARRRG